MLLRFGTKVSKKNVLMLEWALYKIFDTPTVLIPQNGAAQTPSNPYSLASGCRELEPLVCPGSRGFLFLCCGSIPWFSPKWPLSLFFGILLFPGFSCLWTRHTVPNSRSFLLDNSWVLTVDSEISCPENQVPTHNCRFILSKFCSQNYLFYMLSKFCDKPALDLSKWVQNSFNNCRSHQISWIGHDGPLTHKKLA